MTILCIDGESDWNGCHALSRFEAWQRKELHYGDRILLIKGKTVTAKKAKNGRDHQNPQRPHTDLVSFNLTWKVFIFRNIDHISFPIQFLIKRSIYDIYYTFLTYFNFQSDIRRCTRGPSPTVSGYDPHKNTNTATRNNILSELQRLRNLLFLVFMGSQKHCYARTRLGCDSKGPLSSISPIIPLETITAWTNPQPSAAIAAYRSKRQRF